MLTKKSLLVVFFCSLILPICPSLFGQATGSFSGTVSDNSGAVVAGAKVTITAQATNISRGTTTDDTGHYLVPLLAVGDYTIRVEATGFKAAESKDQRLQVDERRELNFKLVPASVTTSVDVSATEVAVQTTNATLGQVITSQQVADLPLNGRDFVQLATLTPGTTQETSPASFFNGGPSSEVSTRGTYSLSVGGSRAQSTDWLLDGNDNNELTAGGIAILPSIDAIQEFKVLTYTYSAEWGTRAGPTVLVTTKSGTNNLHGSLFEFFRNTKLDATQDFASTKDKFNLNQFGGSLGGAIQKDKTFFFVDYQGTRKRRGVPFSGLIPTPAMIGGDFSQDPFGVSRPNTFDGDTNPDGFGDLVNPYTFTPFQCDAITGDPLDAGAGGVQPAGVDCNKIPTNMFDPAGKGMMNLYPTSNTSNPGLGVNFTNVPTRKLNEAEFDVRVDHNFSSKDSVFARFSYDQAVSFVPGGSPGFAEQGAFASTQNITNHGRNAVISETHIFSDRNINQFTFGFNRIFNHILSFGDRTCEAANLGIVNANLNSSCPNAPAGVTTQSTKDCISCGVTSTLMGAYWPLGDRGFAPFQGGTNVFSISDSFDMIRGKHDIKVGGGIRAQQMNVETNAFQDGFFIAQLFPGQFTGDSAADLLLGQVGGALHDQTFLGATTGRRWKLFRPYIQDDWRVTNDLTVNIGLAWALVTPITEAHNRQADFDFATGRYLVAGPTSLISDCSNCVHTDGRAGIQMDKTALEPRIGLAWKPMGSQKTAVRVGYSIFHDSSWNQGGQGLWENPPYFAESDNFPFITCPLGNGTSPDPVPCGVMQSFTGPFLFTSPVNPQNFTGTIQSQNVNFKQGRVQQFNANVERQLPGNVVLTAGYVGSRSHHILMDGVNLNVGSPSACDPTSANYDPTYTLGCAPGGGALVAPYGPFTTVANTNDVGNAKYDSFAIKAETKSSQHGLYALLGYTYSRTYDSGFADGLGTLPGATYWPLPGNQKADWALSALNLDHQFTASFLYDLPIGKGKRFGGDWSGAANTILGNWEVNVIERAISGFPLFVVSGNGSQVNFQWNGSSLNRPDEVGDPNKAGPVAANPTCDAPAQIHTVDAWFNKCAFVDAGPGKLGNANRAPVSGPRYVNTDLSLIKHFPIRENIKLDFRAEFFNLLNHPQYFLPGDPGTSGMQNADTPSFAKITGVVKDPRVIQFALKLNF
ncbi:MAG: carboxypeptidase-like regulatory domain-containing protein [Acidobacteriia bacterium]|nr:carboxypeptidase-like regulatory domain-containing protein [Terriglobia bacterium]